MPTAQSSPNPAAQSNLPATQPNSLHVSHVPGPDGRAASLYSSSIGLLIADLVADMEPLPTILKRYSLAKPQFAALLKNDTFRQAVKAQRALFQATANIPNRIQLKAQLAVEELMGEMIAITSNPAQPGAARVAAYSKLQALTGLEKPEAPQPKPKFSLTLNIATNPDNPDDTLTIKGEIDEAAEEITEELSLAGPVPEPDAHIPSRGGWHANPAVPVGQLKNPPQRFERRPVSIISPTGVTSS